MLVTYNLMVIGIIIILQNKIRFYLYTKYDTLQPLIIAKINFGFIYSKQGTKMEFVFEDYNSNADIVDTIWKNIS